MGFKLLAKCHHPSRKFSSLILHPGSANSTNAIRKTINKKNKREKKPPLRISASFYCDSFTLNSTGENAQTIANSKFKKLIVTRTACLEKIKAKVDQQ